MFKLKATAYFATTSVTKKKVLAIFPLQEESLELMQVEFEKMEDYWQVCRYHRHCKINRQTMEVLLKGKAQYG
jgi:hypothetical protein